MKKQATKYYIILLLIAMFAAPGIAAYWVFQHPSWLGSAKVNKGTLLNPPVLLASLAKQKKWRIVLWSPDICETSCLQQLDVLARIRLALGRKLYQVDQWLFLGDKAPALSPKVKSTLKELDFQVAQLPAAEINAESALFSAEKVFLVDPNNYVILSYSPTGNPDDIYKDLKLLLTTTEKSG